MPSLLAALGVFCGAGNLEGGSGGLTGGLQMGCFSVDLVLVRPSESPEKTKQNKKNKLHVTTHENVKQLRNSQ